MKSWRGAAVFSIGQRGFHFPSGVPHHGPPRLGRGGWLVVLAIVLLGTAGCGIDQTPGPAEEGVPGRPVGMTWPLARPTSAVAGETRPSPVDSDVIQVVATVGMVADVVRRVGGERVSVTQLMGSGVDPHLYRVTRDDVRAIYAADVVFSSGWLLEGKLSDALDRLSRRKPIEPLGEWVWNHRHPGRPLQTDASGELVDPHVWMDIGMWAEGALRVAEVLGNRLPRYREEFTQRASDYREELLALDRWGRDMIGTIPAERRLLITAHEAFGHFARAYGLEAKGVQGLATDSEAGLVRINHLVEQIVTRQVAAVFVESSVPRKSLEAVAEGARARGHQVRIGGELYSDACGPAGTYEGTYFGMMDHNLTVVARGLGGIAPARGYRGKLAVGHTNGTDLADARSIPGDSDPPGGAL